MDQGRIETEVGYQPISMAEIKSYLDLVGEYSPDERLKFISHIRELDSVMLKNKKNRAASG